MSNNMEKFLRLYKMAGAVTIDGGILLSDLSEIAQLTGEPDNQVVRFDWTDGEDDYSDILTEGGINEGVFDSDDKFVVENSEGEKTVIRFFVLERLTGKCAATQFFKELLDSVETLTGIAEEHGARTLADLMYLQNAILDGGFIDCYPDESKVMEIAGALPSGEQWTKFVKVGYMLSNDAIYDNYDESYSEALVIGAVKQICDPVDPATDQRLEGHVLGVTSKHVVLSIGRSAVICDLDDLDRTPEKNGNAVIVFSGGKGVVEPAKEKKIDQGR